MAKKGSLTINSENIFPIIKKWMYSDHDIFARELVSNGCDAITKLKKLDMIGQYSIPDGKDMEWNGAVPDIIVKNSPSDLVRGVDAQLEAAIKALSEDVEKAKKSSSPVVCRPVR